MSAPTTREPRVDGALTAITVMEAMLRKDEGTVRELLDTLDLVELRLLAWGLAQCLTEHLVAEVSEERVREHIELERQAILAKEATR